MSTCNSVWNRSLVAWPAGVRSIYQSIPDDALSMCAESTSFPLNPSLFKDSRKCAIETDSSGVEFVGWII